MKVFFITLSILLNFVLLAVVVQFKMIDRPLETIVQTHAGNEDEVSSTLAASRRVAPMELSPDGPELGDEPNETHEKMETERTTFLTRDLGLPQEKLLKFQKLRNEYFQQTSKLWDTNPYGELSFKDRRKMLDMEEKLHHDLVELMGQKDWARYSKFREAYNKRGFEKQIEENVPFLFMGL
jgi:hypothetical protein